MGAGLRPQAYSKGSGSRGELTHGLWDWKVNDTEYEIREIKLRPMSHVFSRGHPGGDL